MPPKTLYAPWPPDVIQAIANVLASTDWPGLSNTEITRLLGMLGIADVEASNKRSRLSGTLLNQQHRNRASNCIIRFITEAMAPGRFLQDQRRFDALRDGLKGLYK